MLFRSLLVIALTTGTGRAVAGENAALTPLPPPDSKKVEWKEHWPKFAGWEWALTGTMLGATAGIILFDTAHDPTWKSTLVLEDPVRDGLRAHTPAGRERAQQIGNATYYGALAYPLIDVVAVTWLGHGNGEAAAQMALIDTEALSVTGFLSFLSNAVIRRQRPYVRECDKADDYGFPDCAAGGKSESFFSGHTGIAATTAGLTCAHHANMPLYGGGIGDSIACGATIAGALVTGYARLVADKHYLFDVVVGELIGFPIGYLFASRHYRPMSKVTSMNLRFAPMLADGVTGGSIIGLL